MRGKIKERYIWKPTSEYIFKTIKSEYDKVGVSSMLRNDGFSVFGVLEIYDIKEDKEK